MIPDLTNEARRLFAQAGLPSDEPRVTPLAGGRNNRVYEARNVHGVYLMKRYYAPPHDSRDRLGHEAAFLTHLEQNGCRYGPRLLAAIPAEHLALLEFIVGTRLHLADVDAAAVDAAAEFFVQANAVSQTRLPAASEACFSIAEHLETSQRRVDRLAQLSVMDELDAEAQHFVTFELTPAWRQICSDIEDEWPDPAPRRAALPLPERCLSPSDFGFHNALREPTGRLRFVDFEYAGWDDPAKLVCDFANQPDQLLPRPLSDRFQQAVLAWSPNPVALARRIAALEPLYQLKWACICLNDFLGSGRLRRDFTGATDEEQSRRAYQLGRARHMLERATTRFHHAFGH